MTEPGSSASAPALTQAEARPAGRATAVAHAAAYIPHVVLLAAIAALSFLSGGYVMSRAAPVVMILTIALLAWVWLGPRHRPRLAYALGLGGLAAYALWAAVSVVWSIAPDLTWVAVDYALLYLVAACVVGLAPAGRGQLLLTGYGYVVVAVPVAVYAMLGKILPDVVEHAHTYARLSDPLGYWNVLAMMMVFAIVPGLEGAARRGMPVLLRGLFAAATALFAFTLVFALSRGGSLALVIALGVYFVLTNERLSSFASLVLIAAPVTVAIYRDRGLSTLFESTTDDVLRTAQGHAFGRTALIALAVVAIVQIVVALVHRRVSLGGAPRRIVGALVLAVALVGVAAGTWTYMDRLGGPRDFAHSIADQFRDTGAPSGPAEGSDRMLSVSSNGRVAIWKMARQQSQTHRLAGTGAGTFRYTLYRYRPSGSYVVKHAHSQWMNALSELGVVGFVIFTFVAAGLVVAALWPVGKGRRDRDRGLLAALQGGLAAFVVRLLVDWDWDMAAVTLVFLLFAGVAAVWGRGATDAAPGGRLVRASLGRRLFATGFLALMAVSWLLPALSERAYSDAVRMASEDRPVEAMAAARRAHRLDPLAVDPLITLALVQQQTGAAREALATLKQAADLQPENYKVHYHLGLMHLNLGQNREAAAAFRRALALNPYDDESQTQLGVAEQR